MITTPVSHVFTRFALHERPTGALGEIVDRLVEGSLDRSSYDAIVASAPASEREALATERLDLVVFVARAFLVDHSLDHQEAETLRQLAVLLRVEDGEFVRCRSEALGVLLRAEMRRVVSDGVVGWTEEAYLAAIQAAFRLGYDEFLDLACGELTREERRALRLP